jgi:hypothetical protein
MKRLLAVLLGVASCATVFGQGSVADIRLNEILASGNAFKNASGNGYDRIELYNTSVDPVVLDGMALSDKTGLPKYRFASGTTIGGHNFLVVNLDPDGTNNTFHINRPGDTVYYGYDIGDENPVVPVDYITFGQQLTDVSIGRDPDGTGEWVLLSQMSFGLPNLGAIYGDQRLLKINEWMANSDSIADYIEIYNPQADPVNMGGMTIEDAGHIPYVLPPLTFVGTGNNGFIVYFATDDTTEGDHLPFKLGSSTDEVILKLGDGTEVDHIGWGGGQTYPAPSKDTSAGRIPDGGTNIIKFPKHPTPGAPNFGTIDAIFVNELLTHTDPPFEDAIEFYNPWPTNVNIGGWYLGGIEPWKENPEGDEFIQRLKRYQFPLGTIVPARGYLVLYEGTFRNNPLDDNFTFNSAHGGSLFLSQPNDTGDVVAYLERTYGPAANNVSFGRITNSDGDVDFVAMECLSFGVDHPKSVVQFRQGTGAPNDCGAKWGPVIINEVMYQPPLLDGTNNVIGEYIELRNVTGSRVPLFDPLANTNGYRIRGGVSFNFTNTDFIEANSFLLLVSFDPVAEPGTLAWFRTTYNVPTEVPIRGPYEGKLANEDDIVELYRPDPPQGVIHPDAGFVPRILTDRVHYEQKTPWPTGSQGTGLSLQRVLQPSYGDEPSAWRDDLTTAGRLNALPIVILSQPQDQTVLVSNAAVFAVSIDPSATSPQYQWLFKKKPLAGQTNSTLTITFPTRKNAGLYACVITNATGRTVTSNALLTVITPVTIRSQPQSRTVATGGKVVFSTKATGTKPITYQWYLNGSAIQDATNSKLTLLNVGQANAGTYTATARNVLSSADTLPATLTVTP